MVAACCYCVFEELTVVFAVRITTASDELVKCEAYEDSRKGKNHFFQLIYVFTTPRQIVIPIFVFIQIDLNYEFIILHKRVKRRKFLFRVFPILYFSPTIVTHIFFTHHWLIVSGGILNYLI
jgi:hypothetical protein